MRSAQDNIDLQSTILSRFDLIFIVKDPASEDRDRQIANKVRTGTARLPTRWLGRGGKGGCWLELLAGAAGQGCWLGMLVGAASQGC